MLRRALVIRLTFYGNRQRREIRYAARTLYRSSICDQKSVLKHKLWKLLYEFIGCCHWILAGDTVKVGHFVCPINRPVKFDNLIVATYVVGYRLNLDINSRKSVFKESVIIERHQTDLSILKPSVP